MSESYDRKDINTIQQENLELLQKSMIDNEEKIQSQNFSEESKNEAISEIAIVSDNIADNVLEPIVEEIAEPVVLEEIVLKTSIFRKTLSTLGFLGRYLVTAGFIFVILMAFTNYSAYITIAKSYLNPEAMAQWEAQINKSIEVSKIVLNNEEVVGIQEKMVTENNEAENEITEKKDIRDIVWDIRSEEINLDIEIIPFVNRVVIPKIAKNIPLIDIEQGNVEDFDELNGIFMDELKSWVVRYPGSAKPWDYGNSFIFGHSSNFPWIPWDYNDVFVLLDKLEIGDEVITYYEWQKYVYKIKEKKVINPNDVSILKRDTGKKEITLMTCWPIGTTYNRLLLIGELVND